MYECPERSVRMTAKNPKAIYACVNFGEAICPEDIGAYDTCGHLCRYCYANECKDVLNQ